MSEDTPSTDDTQTHRETEHTRPEWAVTDGSLIEALNGEVHPLSTTDPDADGEDLAPIGAAFGRARVIALGEATHGTREFFRLKHRLIRRLVTERGVRLLALEANFTETLAIGLVLPQVERPGLSADAQLGMSKLAFVIHAIALAVVTAPGALAIAAFESPRAASAGALLSVGLGALVGVTAFRTAVRRFDRLTLS